MFNFNVYHVQEFIGNSPNGFWAEATLAVLASALGALFGYLLGSFEARRAFRRQQASEKKKIDNADLVFLIYYIELIERSIKCGDKIVLNMDNYLNPVQSDKAVQSYLKESGMSEVDTSFPSRFSSSSSDVARFFTLSQSKISRKVFNKFPVADDISDLTARIDALNGVQRQALKLIHQRSAFTAPFKLTIYSQLDSLERIIGNEKIARILGYEVSSNRSLRELNEQMLEVVKPVEQAIPKMEISEIEKDNVRQCIRKIEEAHENLKKSEANFKEVFQSHLRLTKDNVEEIRQFSRTYLRGKKASFSNHKST